MNSLLRAFLCLIVLWAASPFASAAVGGSDADITHRLTGTWVGKEKGFEGTLEYHPDGVCVSRLEPVDFPVVLFAHPYQFKGTWKIRNGALYSTVTSSNIKAISKGTVYRNEILKLTSDTFTTRNERGWVTEFKKQS